MGAYDFSECSRGHNVPFPPMLLLRSARSLLSSYVRVQASFASRRSIFVMSSEKRNKLKQKSKNPRAQVREEPRKELRKELRKEEHLAGADPDELLGGDRIDRMEYSQKLRSLRELTRTASSVIRSSQQQNPSESEERHSHKEISEEPSGSTEAFDPSTSSLAAPAVAIPQSVCERLGLAMKYLVNKHTQNWPMVLEQLSQEGGLKGLPQRDIRKLVYAIPMDQLSHVFPKIESLLKDAGVAMSPKILNKYLGSLLYGPRIDQAALAHAEQVVETIRSVSKKGKLPRETYELMVQAHGKNLDIDKVNQVVAEMQAHKLAPSKATYSNVLSTCVYKARNHRAAAELFDYMKFESSKTKPSTKEYQHMIVSHVLDNDVEKALDLYEEMLLAKIPVNQSILVALARGCASREQLKMKAWQFMFDIYDRDWVPEVGTAEFMLYLAASDGDLTMARALYQQLNLSHCSLDRSFAYLLKAYAAAATNENRIPTITFNEWGKRFRSNILAKTSLLPATDNPRQALPFLPLVELTTANELMAESSAMMAHSVMANPDFITIASINNYLNVAAVAGTLDDFVDRFHEFTYLDQTGIPQTRLVHVELADETVAAPGQRTDAKSPTKSPLLGEIMVANGQRFSKPRNSVTYMHALKAAAKHRNYDFAQSIWTERGNFRKSDLFKQLLRSEKDKQDFAFASAMVQALTTMKLYDDALAVIVSTEYQFKWTWPHFRDLYDGAAALGLSKITQTLRGIASRAQMKFSGKIRKRDFKRHMMANR